MKKNTKRKYQGIMKTCICVVLSLVLAVGMLPNGIYAEGLEIPEVEVLEVESTETESAAPDTAYSVENIEINQGFSKHTKREGGEQTLIREFAANKDTAIMMKIPGSDGLTQEEARERANDFEIEVYPVVGGRESDDYELYDSLEDRGFNVIRIYDKDCNPEAGWYLEFIINKGLS